jgi:hypothetical protein
MARTDAWLRAGPSRVRRLDRALGLDGEKQARRAALAAGEGRQTVG